MARWPPPVYRAEAIFRAPLAFAYRWCTDFRPDDARLIGEKYERRILRRARRRVLFEDLWWEADGWRWRRSDVSLNPPDRWVAESLGNVREARLEYRLTALSDDRTRFELTMHRRPTARSPRQPPKAELEGELHEMWRDYGRALERAYRASRRERAPPRAGRLGRR